MVEAKRKQANSEIITKLYCGDEAKMEYDETIDTDTRCPVCGCENKDYAEGKTDNRYDGCEDGEPDEVRKCQTCGVDLSETKRYPFNVGGHPICQSCYTKEVKRK